MTDFLAKSLVSTVCVLLIHFSQTGGEVFTSIAEMEELLETEAHFLSNLDSFIALEEEKINFLKRRAEVFRKEQHLSESDPAGYVSNPMNAFLLTKRLTSDWKSIEEVIAKEYGSEYMEKIASMKQSSKLPTEEDLNGAATALVRLQDTYKLDTSSVARGELYGMQYSTEMTASDCFEIGRQSYANKDFYYTNLWMLEAVNRLTTDTSDTSRTGVNRSEILEFLSNSSYHQGNIVAALQYTNQLLDILPDDRKANGNKILYEKRIKEEAAKGLGRNEELPSSKPKTNETLRYEMLCRNEIRLSPAVLSELNCKYVTNRSPFLKIAPLKLEEVCLKPYIVIYHEVMSDAEIDVIKTMARPRFKRATVGNDKKVGVKPANYRISKSAWLKDDEHKSIQDISNRVEDMTGLSAGVNNALQVGNYGIGGHYTPHLDFNKLVEISTLKDFGSGNPIVTVLFYMSDVAQGGATVFPKLDVAIWPKKGSAAFWYNFQTSGKGDLSTLHAACPVLVGSKWVSNKWLHQRYQKFVRPYKLWKTT